MLLRHCIIHERLASTRKAALLIPAKSLSMLICFKHSDPLAYRVSRWRSYRRSHLSVKDLLLWLEDISSCFTSKDYTIFIPIIVQRSEVCFRTWRHSSSLADQVCYVRLPFMLLMDSQTIDWLQLQAIRGIIRWSSGLQKQ